MLNACQVVLLCPHKVIQTAAAVPLRPADCAQLQQHSSRHLRQIHIHSSLQGDWQQSPTDSRQDAPQQVPARAE